MLNNMRSYPLCHTSARTTCGKNRKLESDRPAEAVHQSLRPRRWCLTDELERADQSQRHGCCHQGLTTSSRPRDVLCTLWRQVRAWRRREGCRACFHSMAGLGKNVGYEMRLRWSMDSIHYCVGVVVFSILCAKEELCSEALQATRVRL